MQEPVLVIRKRVQFALRVYILNIVSVLAGKPRGPEEWCPILESALERKIQITN